MTIAARLVNELMLVSVLVAGEGAADLATALEHEGVAAETLAGASVPDGFDLAILLVTPATVADPGMRQLVAKLSGASERLLLAPVPLGAATAGGTPGFPELTEWFEVLAEHGYQPVVEFDAGFVSPGAFLVDRAATAAESELSAFAERLQLGPDARGRRLDDQPGPSDRDELRTRLQAAEAALSASAADLETSRAELASLRGHTAEAEAREAALQDMLRDAEGREAGWDGLRQWVRVAVADPARDTEAALARDLPQINAWRSPAPPFELARPRRLARLWTRPRMATPSILADTAQIRASHLFDAAWYVAATPELAGTAAVDPVFHYVLVGCLTGADPGPWFDTAAYVAAHPEIAGTGACPLLHAIRTGADRVITAG